MVGQNKIRARLFSQPLSNLPKTMLFLGEYGCGKHTLAKELAEHFGLDLHDITDSISSDLLESIRFSSVPSMYVVSVDGITEKQQNMLLKFAEEPCENAYVILLCGNRNSVLDTVFNRCSSFEFEPYTADEIEEIVGHIEHREMLGVCQTPGQIKLADPNYDGLLSLCRAIVGRIGEASIGNALTISSKINYKDEYDKYDFTVFMKVLIDELAKSYASTGDERTFRMYGVVQEQSRRLADGRLNREVFMNHLITSLWLAYREDGR